MFFAITDFYVNVSPIVVKNLVQQLWDAHHSNDTENSEFDINTMENLQLDELKVLIQYIHGESPRWGNRTPWSKIDQVTFCVI